MQPLIFKFHNSDQDCAIFQFENPTVHLTHSRTFLERRQGSIKCTVCEPSLTLTKGLDAAQCTCEHVAYTLYNLLSHVRGIHEIYKGNRLIAFQ